MENSQKREREKPFLTYWIPYKKHIHMCEAQS